MHQQKAIFHLHFIFLLLLFFISTKAVPNIPETELLIIKCGECPCINSCSQQTQPPSPSPPPPSPLPPPTATDHFPPQAPPPPRFVYFTNHPDPLSPPPPRFTFVTGIPSDPTPPSPRFYYVKGPPDPANLNPIDPFNLEINSIATVEFPDLSLLLVGCGLPLIMVFLGI